MAPITTPRNGGHRRQQAVATTSPTLTPVQRKTEKIAVALVSARSSHSRRSLRIPYRRLFARMDPLPLEAFRSEVVTC